MMNRFLKCSALLSCLVAPISAQAQGIIGGAATGTENGNAAAGPVGAVVGGVVGGVSGGIDGLLGIGQRPRFREFVKHENRPSFRYQEEVRTGVFLPAGGLEYYAVPSTYGAKGYSYTVVNDQTVLVDPRTHKIVQIIE